jgi:predicted HTH domain antitoxin
MPQLTFDSPATVFSALRRSPSEFAAKMRLAAAIHWYDQGMVSQGTAAEIAGLR